MMDRRSKLVRICWITGTIILIVSTILIGISQLCLENKIGHYKEKLVSAENDLKIRFGENNVIYRNEIVNSNITLNTYRILYESGKSEKSLEPIWNEFLRQRKVAFKYWYAFNTGDLPNDSIVRSWDSAVTFEDLKAINDSIIKSNTHQELLDKIANLKSQADKYSNTQNDILIIALIIQVFGLILVSASDLFSDKSKSGNQQA
ncbi:MAG: hypothetical protein V3V99_14580 [candidate division Zixibacteria bacterium]